MSDDVLDLDPSRIEAALDDLRGLASQLQAIVDKFQANHERYQGWNGEASNPDDYFRKTQPDDEEQLQTVTAALSAVGTAITELEGGLVESLASVRTTQTDVLDMIDREQKKSAGLGGDDSGYDSDSGPSGGGKH